jgi:hypothetical protein
MNAVLITDVRNMAAQNVFQIINVVHPNIVANVSTTTTTMSAVEAVLGKHATRVMTAEAQENIAHCLKSVIEVPSIFARKTVTAQAMVNVVVLTHALVPVVHVHPIQIALRRRIVVDVAISRVHATQVVSGSIVSTMEIAVGLKNFVTRIRWNVRRPTKVCPAGQ